MEKAITTGMVTAVCLGFLILGFYAGKMSPALDIFGYKIPPCSITWK